MIPNTIKAVLTQRIPDHLIKERENGKNKLSYISGSTVTGILNQAFGFDWDWTAEREWIETSEKKFKPDNNYQKAPDDRAVIYNGKRGEWNIEPPIAHVRGLLTVRFIDEQGERRAILKSGHGSKAIIGGASEQDSIFKAASTDALKRAAMLLGVGLQLYRDDNELAYFEQIDYVDPWTDELREKHKEDFDFFESFKLNFDDPSTVMDQYVYAYTDGFSNSMTAITPSNIKAFVAYCKSALGQ